MKMAVGWNGHGMDFIGFAKVQLYSAHPYDF